MKGSVHDASPAKGFWVKRCVFVKNLHTFERDGRMHGQDEKMVEEGRDVASHAQPGLDQSTSCDHVLSALPAPCTTVERPS